MCIKQSPLGDTTTVTELLGVRKLDSLKSAVLLGCVHIRRVHEHIAY